MVAHTLVPLPGRQRQVDVFELKISLFYILSSKMGGLCEEALSQKQRTNKQTEHLSCQSFRIVVMDLGQVCPGTTDTSPWTGSRELPSSGLSTEPQRSASAYSSLLQDTHLTSQPISEKIPWKLKGMFPPWEHAQISRNYC